jgi:hypothetical protein
MSAREAPAGHARKPKIMNSLSWVDYYVKNVDGNIEGYFWPRDIIICGFLDAIQKNLGLSGDIAEIGLLYGKSFVFFDNLRQDGEELHGFDIFRNTTEDDVWRNVKKFGLREGGVSILRRDTFQLSRRELENHLAKNLRLLHIDGGHRHEECYHDLSIFTPFLADQGVVIVDDIFSRVCPGVTSGLVDFCLSPEGRNLRPFLLGQNKIYLCNRAHVDTYKAPFIETPFFRNNLWKYSFLDIDMLVAFSEHVAEF